MAMTRMKIFSLLFLCISAAANNFIIDFDIPNNNQDSNLIDLRAKAESNKLIRDNAYRSFNIDHFKKNEISSCWKDFIKNKKIKITASESYYKLINQDSLFFTYRLYFDSNRIIVENISKSDFIKYCRNLNNTYIN